MPVRSRRVIREHCCAFIPSVDSPLLVWSLAQVYPLEKVGEAHARMEADRNTGKIVLRVAAEAEDEVRLCVAAFLCLRLCCALCLCASRLVCEFVLRVVAAEEDEASGVACFLVSSRVIGVLLCLAGFA